MSGVCPSRRGSTCLKAQETGNPLLLVTPRRGVKEYTKRRNPHASPELARMTSSFSTYLTPSCADNADDHESNPLSDNAGIVKRMPL